MLAFGTLESGIGRHGIISGDGRLGEWCDWLIGGESAGVGAMDAMRCKGEKKSLNPDAMQPDAASLLTPHRVHRLHNHHIIESQTNPPSQPIIRI